MGKSPGKWIKTVLFGKKSSKSSFSKISTVEKKASYAAKEDHGDLGVICPAISDLPPETTDTGVETSQILCRSTAPIPCDAVMSYPGKEGTNTEATVELISANDVENKRLEQAAIKAQAAFRGYLARRAFGALKGIIRLQALVRGHLVRRQAIATFRCMRAIVKFQVLIHGRRVRVCDDGGREVLNTCSSGKPLDAKLMGFYGLQSEKLSTNAFINKLLASRPTALPLSLQYDPVEPNSSSNWLERWSTSRFWESSSQTKNISDSKKKTTVLPTLGTEPGRPSKRGIRKVSGVNVDSDSLHSAAESEKHKRNLKKSLSHQAELVQDNPQSELEKVKRSLRKISVSTEDLIDKSETVVTEKPRRSSVKKVSSSSPVPDASDQKMDRFPEKMSNPVFPVSKQPEVEIPTKSAAKKVSSSSPVPDVSDQKMDRSSEKMSNPVFPVSKQIDVEIPTKLLAADEAVDDHPVIEVIENPIITEDLGSKENERTRRRRSFSAKQEYPENISQNTPTLPSYMAATESAKAKLRAQGSPRLGQDGAENVLVRRQSLPSSASGGKLSSQSPRMLRPVQANGKAGNRSDRLASRDEKGLAAEWRR